MEDILDRIYNAGLKFQNSKSLKESYRVVVKEFLPVFDGFEGSILIQDNGELKRIYSTTPLFDSIKFGKDDVRYEAFKRILPKVLSEKELLRQIAKFPVLKKAGVKSIIIVPLSYAKKPIGLLSIWSKKRKPRIKKDPSTIKILGMIVTLFLEELKRSRSPETPEEILSKIYNSALKFLSPLSPEETYERIVQEAIKLVGGEYGTILLGYGGELKRVYSSSQIANKIETRKGGSRYQVYKTQKSKILHLKQVKRLEKIHPALGELHARSIILVPLSNQGESIGVLNVISLKNKYFTKRDLDVLKLFGSLASMAIRKSQLYQETKKALETRDLFISMAAHELRTPLTSVSGYFQLLRGRMENKKQVPSKWIEDMEVEIKRLRQIAEEFLEINRIRSGKLQYDFKEIRLKKLITRSIAAFKFSHPEMKITFADVTLQNDKIIGDRDKLIQVMTNILENAVKYSRPDSEVEVNLKNVGQDFIVEIKDQGQGIPKEDLPLIFKDFYKGKNSLHEGMGLGLYLSRNIVEDHHGKIKIDSKIGKGTIVKIVLPVSESGGEL